MAAIDRLTTVKVFGLGLALALALAALNAKNGQQVCATGEQRCVSSRCRA